MDFEDKVVLVTGSSSGIGRATALAFAKLGANVVVNSRSSVQGGNEVVEQISQLGGNAIYVKADVTIPSEVEVLFSDTLKHYGKLDVLINNAGGASGKEFLASTKSDWLLGFEQNVISAVLCSQQAVKIMRSGSARQFSIINNASVRGIPEAGRQSIMPYSAAKAALINFTKTLAKELAPEITVNAVAPGFVSNPYYDSLPEDLQQHFIRNTPIGRFIDSEEVAKAFVYLASSPSITGTILVIDGGFTLKLA